jgi:hypothetical protein
MEDVKSPAVKEFVSIAAEFCRLLEQASGKRTGEFFNELQQMLPRLYMKAVVLPHPKFCYEEEPTTFVQEDDYARIHDTLQKKFDLYNGITGMSPGTLPNQHELISFGMAESYTDIYEMLKNFVKLYDVGLPQSMNDALWFCRKNFENSLGIKILEGLRSLHMLIYNKERTGSRAIQSDDFESNAVDEGDDDEPWFSDDQEQVYGDDE